MGNKEPFGMLMSTWTTSRQRTIGRAAWFVLVARRTLQRTVSLLL
jgi:hypothetical protein